MKYITNKNYREIGIKKHNELVNKRNMIEREFNIKYYNIKRHIKVNIKQFILFIINKLKKD